MTINNLPIRLERRLKPPSRVLTVCLPVASCLFALAVAALVLLVSGQNPITTYQTMWESAFTETGALSATLVAACPLIFTGLAAALAFRMKVWNIGGEGQLYTGAVCATAAGLALGSAQPIVVITAMAVAGAVGGGIWAAISGLLRAFLNTNEILTSLMLNYVAGLLMYYLIFDSKSYWRDLVSPQGKQFPTGKTLGSSASWSPVTAGSVSVPLGFIVGAVVAVAIFVLIRRTRIGFKLRVVAESPATGRYAGIRTRFMIVAVMVGSGALAGIGGASQIGINHVLDPQGLEQSQFGYTGIVAAALANYNALGVILSAVFLGAISNAGYNAQSGVTQGLIGVIQGIILFGVLAGGILLRYRVRIGKPPSPGSGDRSAADVTPTAIDEAEADAGSLI